jgi:hypothetical protein
VNLIEIAAGHIRNILAKSIKRSPTERVLVVYDRQSGLSSLMADAYQLAIPDAVSLDFDVAGEAGVRAALDELKQGDVVILVQSTSFRLNEFRIRIELFARKLKTVEHVHLNRMPEEQWATWIDTLSFDPNLGGETGRALKKILDEAQTITIECGDAKLTWQGGMEACKLNIGDYTGMENIGGTFPIGEVFTEARELERTNGELKIYAFADENFLVKFYEPFTAIVKDGLIEAGPGAPKEFVDKSVDLEFSVGALKLPRFRKYFADRKRATDIFHAGIVADIQFAGLHAALPGQLCVAAFDRDCLRLVQNLLERTARLPAQIRIKRQRVDPSGPLLFRHAVQMDMFDGLELTREELDADTELVQAEARALDENHDIPLLQLVQGRAHARFAGDIKIQGYCVRNRELIRVGHQGRQAALAVIHHQDALGGRTLNGFGQDIPDMSGGDFDEIHGAKIAYFKEKEKARS